MAYEHLTVSGEGRLATVTLDRPQRLNALSPALMRELIAAAAWLAARRDVSVVVLAGSGRAFSAGFDLDAIGSVQGAVTRDEADLGRRMLEAWGALDAITIAAVRGACVGGGMLLAGACDLRVVSSDASFFIPELDLGIPLAWGGVPRLVRLLGPTLAMELVLDGTRFDAAQALAWRFVNRVVDAHALADEARQWAERLARHPPSVLRAIKRRFTGAVEALSPTAGSECDTDDLLAALRDPQAQEALRAYLLQRRPR